MKELTAQRAREAFRYDEHLGVLYWAIKKKGTRGIGMAAGCLQPDGYVIVKIDGEYHRAHRIIWLMAYGYFPETVDHRDGNRSNNRISNLREATLQEQPQNAAKHNGNTSGHVGVCWVTKDKKWKAQIQANKIKRNLGLFDSKEAAIAAYVAAKKELHPFQPTVRK